MRDQKPRNEAAKLAWDMFEKTGDVGYYMLYHELAKKD
ncbi:MAG: YqzL family protein [Clostridia bacterium]|nr:YqzL family protein [Clostridia bacterium]